MSTRGFAAPFPIGKGEKAEGSWIWCRAGAVGAGALGAGSVGFWQERGSSGPGWGTCGEARGC